MTPRARTLIDALAAELLQGRVTGAATLPRAAVVVALEDAAGGSQATILLDGAVVRVRDGRFVPPMFPCATVRGSETAFADVLTGRARFVDLAATGALAVDGPAAILAALAAHLRPGQSPLMTRIGR